MKTSADWVARLWERIRIHVLVLRISLFIRSPSEHVVPRAHLGIYEHTIACVG